MALPVVRSAGGRGVGERGRKRQQRQIRFQTYQYNSIVNSLTCTSQITVSVMPLKLFKKSLHKHNTQTNKQHIFNMHNISKK